MVYVKHFDILGIDTAQIPCIELQGAPNAATVGAVGLLGLDVTSDSGDVYLCTKVEGAIYTWKALLKGKDGSCVVKSEINVDGELVFTLSDGSTINAGVVKGEPGVQGEPGKDGENGADGKDGADGEPGADGVSIVKVELNVNDEMLITLSNETIVNLGRVRVGFEVVRLI